MERCLLMKPSVSHSLSRRACRPSPTSLPSPCFRSCSSSSSLPSRRALRVLAMAESEGFDLQWQPVFRLEQADLMADAPSLLRTCQDFDWKAQVTELRSLAKLSLSNVSTNKSQSPTSPSKDVNENGRNGNGDTWLLVGLASATLAFAQFIFHFSALAAEEAIQNSEAAEAASRAPAWLTPALLAFPVVSYAIFSVYRDQVNPNARVSDWMFGVAAFVIIANLVLISTIGAWYLWEYSHAYIEQKWTSSPNATRAQAQSVSGAR